MPEYRLSAGSTRLFGGVALYLQCEFKGNVIRFNCNALTVTTGIKHGHREDAVKIEYAPMGSKILFRILTPDSWIRVVDGPQAMDPDEILGPASDGVRLIRYPFFDSRWVADFDAKLAAAGVVPLLSVGTG